MGIQHTLLCLFFICTSFTLCAQNDINWQDIEKAIANKKNLLTVRDQVLQVQQRALQQNDQAAVGRTWYYLLSIADLTNEDTLFFKHGVSLYSILNNRQSPPLLQAIAHMLQANRLNLFKSRFFYRTNKSLFKSYHPVYNYSAMSRETLDSVINLHYDAALAISEQLNIQDVSGLLWISHDPLLFLFKPGFTDLIYAELINNLQTTGYSLKPYDASSWMRLSQDDFIQSLDTASGDRPIFHYYRKWIQYHQPHDPQAWYFIETLARKYIHTYLQQGMFMQKEYEQYLQNLLQSPFTTVKAHAVYQLCLLWNSQADNYNPSAPIPTGRYRHDNPSFDTTYRLHYTKALALFNTHEKLLDSFPFMKNILVKMKAAIETPGMVISLNNKQLPHEPILALLKYRHVSRVYTRLIRLRYNQDVLGNIETQIASLLQMPVYREEAQALPAMDDYQWHNTLLKIDSLPPGKYALLYDDSVIAPGSIVTGYLPFIVSRLAVINNDRRVFVLDRKTGLPLKGATVLFATVQRREAKANLYIWSPASAKKVNDDGYVLAPADKTSIRVFYEHDSIGATINEADPDLPEELFNNDDYDDLLEYYEDQTRLYIFTDRAIYRPGQKVHYKGIFITRHPKTGDPLVLNWKNLKFPLFKKLYYKLLRKLNNEKLEIDINDPFGRIVDSLFILPNKYGSFAGTFTIPKEAPTGDWSIDALEVDMADGNSGEFKVEEYKRPSFELTLEKPVKELRLGDSFTVKAVARSFAGASLNRIKIKYTVSAGGSLPVTTGTNNTRYHNRTLVQQEAFTNDNGELLIVIHDTALQQYHLADSIRWNIAYTVKATAIDGTGENHEEKIVCDLSSWPVIISLPVDNMLDRSNLAPIYISTKSAFAGPVKKPVEVRIYKRPSHSKPNRSAITMSTTDVWLYTKEQLKQWFGLMDAEDPASAVTAEKLVFETTLTAGTDDKLILPAGLLVSGYYRIAVTCRENGHITGETTRHFSVFDKIAGEAPDPTGSFHYLKYNRVEPGNNIQWITGHPGKEVFSIYHLAYYAKSNKGLVVNYNYDIRPQQNGLYEWKYLVPKDAVGEAILTHLYILDNNLYRQEERIFLLETSTAKPEIIIEQYRKKLTPGTKETFSVSIKTNNENTAAELMTTMYDAALDKVEKHNWTPPGFNRQRHNPGSEWDYRITEEVSGYYRENVMGDFNTSSRSGKALWWLNPLDYKYDTMQFSISGNNNLNFALRGRIPGLSVMNTEGLNDVVVVGYGTVQRSYSTAALVQIRGANSLGSYANMPLIIIDGVVFEGDRSQLNVNSITDVMVLKGAEAATIYGARAADGVLVISTKGPLQLTPPETGPPPPVIRKNFSETAFFYPQVHAGTDGYYTIQFTLPESVTAWKWKMLAHTRQADFVYAERTLVSQLPLMVQPDMPRFLYQGDRLVLKSRISNLDSLAVAGTLQCTIEDVVTGQDITSQIVNNRQQSFSIAPSANNTGSFTLTIPSTILHPLKIRISAGTRTFSDGEEYIIPVLAKKILVSQQVPVVLHNTNETTINQPALPADADPYGISLYITPKPQAAMLYALPYLATYPYNCAEQTFNKMLAHCMAVNIMRTDTNAQRAVKQKIVNPAMPEKLPDELGEETMPWLQLNHANAIRQNSLVKLLDSFESNRQVTKHLANLREMQNGDGGMAWFEGGKSDPYISAYILAGFGRLMKDHLLLPAKTTTAEFTRFTGSLLIYCDNLFKNGGLYNSLFYLYARSSWLQKYPLPDSLATRSDSLLKSYWQKVQQSNIGTQALLITTTLRFYGKSAPLHQQAMEQLESIRQLAIHDDINGTRWKDVADADDLNIQTEEWVVKIAEAFEEANTEQTTAKGIIQWLLQTRRQHNWSTTKATADAVSLLHRHQPAITGSPLQWQATVHNNVLQVQDNLFTGQPVAFSPLWGQSFPTGITVKSTGTGMASGGVNYYYFSAQPPVNETGHGVRVAKTLYRYNTAIAQWEEITGLTTLHIAEKVKTVLTINTPLQLQYVFIDEKRAAALEPVDALSGYEYGGSFSYYRSVRDAGYQFFAEKIPAGTTTISYETTVAKEGSFTNGPASLQCMYQPAIKTFSKTSSLTIQP
jgi:TonB-dependent SusC/RagA subfamily outer membrane receptor